MNINESQKHTFNHTWKQIQFKWVIWAILLNWFKVGNLLKRKLSFSRIFLLFF